jgi:outer membrane protein
MKHFVIALCVVIVLFLCTLPAQAAQKIGVVDVQKIMRESKAAKNAQALFMKEVEARRAILFAKEKEVWKLEEEFKNLDPKVSLEVRQDKADKLAREVRELKRLGSDIDEELKKKDAEFTQKLLVEIRQILKTYSRDENYSLLFEKNSLLIADDAVDITDKILKIYDGQNK